MNPIQAGVRYTVETFSPAGILLDVEDFHNLVPDEGLNHLASVVFKSGTQVATWYIAPFEGNYTPVNTLTAATFATAATECTAYTASTRQEFVEGAVTVGAVDNTASKAEFTMNAAKTLYGLAMLSASPKSATTGLLLSIARFPSPKVLDSGSVLRVSAGAAFVSL